jgi:predicted amidophosphoribosyltransferase
MVKGFASAFGLGAALQRAGEATQQAIASTARCPKDGTLAPAGTRFCPECGGAMAQPVVDACPSCGKETHGAKFCPECGAKIERNAAGSCPSCGADTKGAKFCPECGTKLV